MAIIDKAQAQTDAAQIRDETVAGANTATRVGTFLRSLADSLAFTSGVLTHEGISGPFNDYNVAPIATAFGLRFSSPSVATFSGIASQGPGALRMVTNIGTTGTIRLLHESTLSLAQNRFTLPGGFDIDLEIGESALVWHDPVSNRWFAVLRMTGSVPTLEDVLQQGNVASSLIYLAAGSGIIGTNGEFSGSDVTLQGGESNDFTGDGGDINLMVGLGKGGSPDGKIYLEGEVVVGNKQIKNMAEPTGPKDGATKNYVDTHSGSGGAPTAAEYLVSKADGGLSAERVVANSASITWDFATGGAATAARAALTGDVTAPAGSNATALAAITGEPPTTQRAAITAPAVTAGKYWVQSAAAPAPQRPVVTLGEAPGRSEVLSPFPTLRNVLNTTVATVTTALTYTLASMHMVSIGIRVVATGNFAVLILERTIIFARVFGGATFAVAPAIDGVFYRNNLAHDVIVDTDGVNDVRIRVKGVAGESINWEVEAFIQDRPFP